MKAELIHLSEHVDPGYATPIYLVQFAIDGKVAPPVWTTKKARVELGETEWMDGLKMESAAALESSGFVRALTN